ncbi:PQ loop repeat protein [Cordyceps militaris CM01]|uniref:PQ loop repeat protein n=2 Tax=Cordyceps militaris TaxID=73501 RepID=G3JKM2_CORMM|nr:PQ loop repeat protein [Cordyceps militaris CM01]ATY58420.1 PQ loop repeat [Cordyceps militaris]EGX91461.1 PQ loop repeat protein [Cordyceps militaris CM01]
MSFFTAVIGVLAPLMIALSPVLSYGDQALAMHRSKSSAGFSLDIPLIMLVASFLRIFYWPGARYDTSLLVQSVIMVGMQLALLKIALDNRPGPSSKGGESSQPFNGMQANEKGFVEAILNFERPYNFWQWKADKPYWHFLMYFALALCVLQLIFAPIHSFYGFYSEMLGIVGLSVEATLPLPQIVANIQTRACKGFRLSVLASWLIGDAMKMIWFFTSTSEIPWAFKVCGVFQASCDCLLGLQYFFFETQAGAQLLQSTPFASAVSSHHSVQYHQMQQLQDSDWDSHHHPSEYKPALHAPARSLTPTRRPAPFSDDGVE